MVLGWKSRGSTVFLGLRPGARVVGLGMADPRTDPSAHGVFVPGTTHARAINGIEPLVGALFGLDVPIGGDNAFELEVDVTRSFVNPGTVTTLSLGIRN